MNEESKFLGLIDKNVARLVGIIVAVAWVFYTIIIPIQQVSTQLTEINIKLSDFKAGILMAESKNIEQDRRLDKIENDFNHLIK